VVCYFGIAFQKETKLLGFFKMKKQNVIISISIIALLALNFTLKPYLRRRGAIRIVKTVLAHWERGDLTLAMPYWEKGVDSPPVYDLIIYEIGEVKFNKNDGAYYAQIIATLDFPPGNLFPSGKKWIFELNRTRYGWKITDFRLFEN